MSQAGGQYNIILCDDDRLLPHALRTLRSYISRVPRQDVYLFGYQVVDASGQCCYERAAPDSLAISVDEPRLVQRVLEATWLPFLVCHPSTFCSSRGLETSVPYRKDVSIADDYMFLVECLNRGKRLYVLPECLMQYRWAPSTAQQMNQSADNLKVVRAVAKVYYALRRQAEIHPVLNSIIRSTDYRRRFLYDFIIRRRPPSSDPRELGLEGNHGEEFRAYAHRIRRLSVTLRIPIALVAQLTAQFGLRGFRYSIRVGLMYLKYRILRFTARTLSTSNV